MFLHIKVRCNSGNSYRFLINRIQPLRPIETVKFSNDPCVFIVGKLQEAIDYEFLSAGVKIHDMNRFSLIYLGETDDLSMEFRDHPKTCTINKLGADFLFKYVSKNKEHRKEVVNDVLATFKFYCKNPGLSLR
jgi:hypothetical protein